MKIKTEVKTEVEAEVKDGYYNYGGWKYFKVAKGKSITINAGNEPLIKTEI